MQTNKVKLLNNYQLYQITENKQFDDEIRARARNEMIARNISPLELKDLARRYDTSLDSVKVQLDANAWHPFYTAFAWRKHLNHIALLKTCIRYEEANKYRRLFYAGLVFYMLFFIALLLLFKK